MIQSLARSIRWQDWGHSKIPPFFAVGFAFLIATEPPARLGLARFTCWILFCALHLAFGYALNDYCDRAADDRAGKPSTMGRLSLQAAASRLALLLVLGLAAASPFLTDPLAALSVAGTLCLGASYSMRPLRLKERGMLGLLASALAQRSLPLLVGAVLFASYGLDTWLLFLLFTLVGLRWILLHQIIDAPRDQHSQVTTFVTAVGKQPSLRLLKYGIFPAELLLFTGWLLTVSRSAPEVWLIPLFYALYLRLLGARWRSTWPSHSWIAYWNHPLADFYELIWPLFMALIAGIRYPAATILSTALILGQIPYLLRRFSFPPFSRSPAHTENFAKAERSSYRYSQEG